MRTVTLLMRTRLTALCLLGLIAAGVGCSNRPPDDPQDYVAKITAARAAKDADFQATDDPIPADRKSQFLPLSYYPVNESYHVVAALTPATDRVEIMMPTSSGQLRRMVRIGSLSFTLNGQPMTLAAFTENDLDRLFVPFSDLTAGSETYGAGRFLDLDRTGTNLYELDFNRAYIPYCYYNASFECPLPPRENRLQVPVRAGERMRPTA